MADLSEFQREVFSRRDDEPAGRMTADPATSDASLRYVVLRHDGVPDPHFDLMFETSPGSALATWRADRWPIDAQAQLTPLPDHRAEYLTYEGPVSGDRGHVRRVACGSHNVVQRDATVLVVALPDGTTLRLPRC